MLHLASVARKTLVCYYLGFLGLFLLHLTKQMICNVIVDEIRYIYKFYIIKHYISNWIVQHWIIRKILMQWNFSHVIFSEYFVTMYMNFIAWMYIRIANLKIAVIQMLVFLLFEMIIMLSAQPLSNPEIISFLNQQNIR